MSLFLKVAGGLLGSSVVGISGWTIYKSITPSTIGDELTQLNHKLLEDEEKWIKLEEKHKSTGDSDLPKKINSSSSGTTVKEKCLDLWKSSLDKVGSNKETIVTDIKNWCTDNSEALKKINTK